MKQTNKQKGRFKGEINSFTIRVGDFTIPLSIMGRTTRDEISKEREYLNDTIIQWDLTDIYRLLHPTIVDTHRTLSRIEHMLAKKKSLSKFWKDEIIQSIFSNHNVMKLESVTEGNSQKCRN